MATSQSTIDFVLDQLRDVPGVRAGKMFGEYALYCGDKVVALVCDDRLFVKITEPGKVLVGRRYAEGFAYPGAKASMLIGAEDLEDSDRLAELIRATATALPAPKPKKPKAPKPAGAKPAGARPKTKSRARPVGEGRGTKIARPRR
jgi:DNA transformation protein and related proteins